LRAILCVKVVKHIQKPAETAGLTAARAVNGIKAELRDGSHLLGSFMFAKTKLGLSHPAAERLKAEIKAATSTGPAIRSAG
jgi:hypothetical protein